MPSSPRLFFVLMCTRVCLLCCNRPSTHQLSRRQPTTRFSSSLPSPVKSVAACRRRSPTSPPPSPTLSLECTCFDGGAQSAAAFSCVRRIIDTHTHTPIRPQFAAPSLHACLLCIAAAERVGRGVSQGRQSRGASIHSVRVLLVPVLLFPPNFFTLVAHPRALSVAEHSCSEERPPPQRLQRASPRRLCRTCA
jgi:hypothetical protein